jgi:hypothetical protein
MLAQRCGLLGRETGDPRVERVTARRRAAQALFDVRAGRV